jgi:plastocyanin
LLSGALFTGAAVAAFAQAATYNAMLSNFRIDGVPAQVRAGAPLAFNARAMGFPHNLAIDGNGVDLRPTTPNLMDGQSGTITFAALQPGTYTLYCPVGQHRANGMSMTIMAVASPSTLPRTGGAALPLGLAGAGLATAIAGIVLRRRAA